MPGAAVEDMALGAGRPVPVRAIAATEAQAAAIRDEVLRTLDGLTPTPLDIDVTEAAEDPYQQMDISDEANED
jgi:hypothetical protein